MFKFNFHNQSIFAKEIQKRNYSHICKKHELLFFFFLGGNKMKTASISNQIPGSHGNSLYMFLDHFINFHNFSGAGLNTKFKKKTSTITM